MEKCKVCDGKGGVTSDKKVNAKYGCICIPCGGTGKVKKLQRKVKNDICILLF